MLKAKQKLLIWPEVRTRGETVVQDYGVETLNRDGQPLENIIIIIIIIIMAKLQRIRRLIDVRLAVTRPECQY